jgi:WD40 repeat protein
VAFHPEGKILASGDGDGMVTLWDVTTGKEQRTLRAHKILHVAFSPDGKTLTVKRGEF